MKSSFKYQFHFEDILNLIQARVSGLQLCTNWFVRVAGSPTLTLIR